MTSLTEFLLTYDLLLLAAANEQRGSAWLRDQTGIELEAGVLSRDDLMALQRFEQTHREPLRKLWGERDQQQLIESAERIKSATPALVPLTDSSLLRRAGSLALTVVTLALALSGAIALLQFAAADPRRLVPSLVGYLALIGLMLLGWRVLRRRLVGASSAAADAADAPANPAR